MRGFWSPKLPPEGPSRMIALESSFWGLYDPTCMFFTVTYSDHHVEAKCPPQADISLLLPSAL